MFEHLQARRAAAYLLTLTVKHWQGMELRALRSAVSNTWRQVRQLRGYRDALVQLGTFYLQEADAAASVASAGSPPTLGG